MQHEHLGVSDGLPLLLSSSASTLHLTLMTLMMTPLLNAVFMLNCFKVNVVLT